jgi:hypothetical protein
MRRSAAGHRLEDILRDSYKKQTYPGITFTLTYATNKMSITKPVGSTNSNADSDLTSINAALQTIQVSKSADDKIIVLPTESYRVGYTGS